MPIFTTKKLLLICLLAALCTSKLAFATCVAESEAVLEAIKGSRSYRGQPQIYWDNYQIDWKERHARFLSGEIVMGRTINDLNKDIQEKRLRLSQERTEDGKLILNRVVLELEYFRCTVLNPSTRATTNTQSQNDGSASKPLAPANSGNTQQQSQQAQQQAQQAQEAARVAQTRADQARQGKRKTHDPAAEAHQCIDVDVDAPIVGGFKNKCGYAVSYGYCVFNPKKGAWTDSPIFNCNSMIGKTTVGGQDIKANGYDMNHTKGGELVYFFACRQPASAMDLTFIPGQGIQGRCGNLMGN